MAALPNIRIERLPRGKLSLHEEFPDEVVSVIRPFLFEGAGPFARLRLIEIESVSSQHLCEFEAAALGSMDPWLEIQTADDPSTAGAPIVDAALMLKILQRSSVTTSDEGQISRPFADRCRPR